MGMTARVGFVYFGAYPDIRVVKMTDTLAKAGWEVIVLARHIKGVSEPGAAHPYAAKRETAPLEWRKRLHLRRVLDDLPERWRAPLSMPYHINPIWRRAIRDLVVEDGCRLLIVRDIPLVLAATAVGKRYGVPVIFDMAENYPAALSIWRRYEGPWNYLKNALVRNVTLARMVERQAIRASDHILVTVQESHDRVVRLGASPTRVTIVENTPDLDAYNSWSENIGVPDHPLTIVYTGEIHIYRGIDTIIDAARRLTSLGERVCWWLVGSGKFERRVRKLGRDLEASGEIVWHGWKPHAEMLSIIQNADVGIVPHHASEHWHHTMPNKLYDYMAFRKPVLVSDCRPMKRVVETHRCGLVFRSRDAEDLAEKVRMLRDPDLRAEMGARGRQAVEERYHWGVDGKRLVEVVEQILQ